MGVGSGPRDLGDSGGAVGSGGERGYNRRDAAPVGRRDLAGGDPAAEP